MLLKETQGNHALMLCIHGFPEVMYTCFYCFVIFTFIAADVFVNQSH